MLHLVSIRNIRFDSARRVRASTHFASSQTKFDAARETRACTHAPSNLHFVITKLKFLFCFGANQLGRLIQQLDRREEALHTTMRRLGGEV